MGLYAAKNAVLVAARLELGHAATRLLIHMARQCLDEERNGQQPRRYFGSRESSAIALGYSAPANESEPAFQAVKRAVNELMDRGAISRLRTGGRGRTSEYAVLVDSDRPQPLTRCSDQVIRFPLQGVSEQHPKGVNF